MVMVIGSAPEPQGSPRNYKVKDEYCGSGALPMIIIISAYVVAVAIVNVRGVQGGL
jgi:hypothetical protein